MRQFTMENKNTPQLAAGYQDKTFYNLNDAKFRE
jgi:hypothetical protein